VAQFEKEANQTRDYCVAKNATLRAVRLDPSLRKERLLGMTIKYRLSDLLRWRKADWPLPPSQPLREKISRILITFFPQRI
jgi:hypothetical protein